MATEKQHKLNQLITNWMHGTVYTQRYLSRMDYNHDLVKYYRRNNWLASIGQGAYKLTGDNVDWYGGLYALQNQLFLKIFVGGKTALELQGYAHYISEQMQQCYLIGEKGERLPKWFETYDWGLSIIFKSLQLFSPDLETGFKDYSHKEFSVRISAPERAILEMLYFVPGIHGFDESYRIMENLATLRPEVVQELLENCRSVKAKRLFMYMAERAEHTWLERINTHNVDLGRGKRVMVENGKLDNKYNITVPRDL